MAKNRRKTESSNERNDASENVSRRNFLKGATIFGAAVAGTGLAGCAPQAEKKSETEPQETKIEASETRDVDVVILGAGAAGLSAAVEAGERGLSTLVLEKLDTLGGSGSLTSGIFGFNTKYQEALGIELNLGEMLQYELNMYNYRVNAMFFKEMAENSAANIEWLESHGVSFSGLVDDYQPGYGLYTAHWWGSPGDGPSTQGAGTMFTEPLAASAKKLGVEFLTETPGRELIMQDGKVAGAYAEKKDGSYLQVNAKAVVLATGGWVNNPQMMAACGYGENSYLEDSLPGHDGDGVRMAVSAGATDLSLKAAYVEGAHFSDTVWPLPTNELIEGGVPLWINDLGERFCNEACSQDVITYGSNAVKSQKMAYCLVDTSLAEKIGVDAVEEIISCNTYNDKLKADTLEEIADFIGADVKVLKATIERFNELCEKGVDEDFGKKPELMNPCATGPYYIARLTTDTAGSIGGLKTDRNFQVTDILCNPIEGLFAIGNDGCQSYCETYNYHCPGGANGNNVHSGRKAIGYIAENLV